METPFLIIYKGIIKQLRANKNLKDIQIKTPSQDFKKLPVIIMQLINGVPEKIVKNARIYDYEFQFDVVTDKDNLVKGLEIAYQLMDILRNLNIDGYQIILLNDINLSSFIDSSTTQVLNRQMLNVSFQIIEENII
ncbi:hypothetical protein [Ligilactobacillus salivarius]|uniref:hypothetical protein n=1 Tax=Ligilactobacillus salivarius TaxID=1624 RepID=UPI000BAE7365|nr:hypothetical protein [Ligilactobacillus salivarius]MBE7387392.1 hypothetical protein [Ligilactobacillus salivarius]MBE7391786.1 hypothetical protein [Ligilactobacillus salivarius]MDY2639169.1 hypothetical protein [Ligilactobacillus salivarius]MDY5247872.1 hypothetical protein [Ligilactobacillus salivarius]PAY35608.1 hypothetical protein A8C54_08025 [Ligilactobacillus salivarius]